MPPFHTASVEFMVDRPLPALAHATFGEYARKVLFLFLETALVRPINRPFIQKPRMHASRTRNPSRCLHSGQ